MGMLSSVKWWEVITWVLFLKKNEDPDWAPKIGGVRTSAWTNTSLELLLPCYWNCFCWFQVVLSPMQRWLLLATWQHGSVWIYRFDDLSYSRGSSDRHSPTPLGGWSNLQCSSDLRVLRTVKLESFMTPGSVAAGFLSNFCGFGVSGPDVPLLFPGAWALAWALRERDSWRRAGPHLSPFDRALWAPPMATTSNVQRKTEDGTGMPGGLKDGMDMNRM